MKKTILILVSWIFFISFSFAQDTIQIVLDKETKLHITSPDRASLLKLNYLDINYLVREAIRKKNGQTNTENEEDNNNNNANNKHYRLAYHLNNNFEERAERRQECDSLRRARGWDSHNEWGLSAGFGSFLEKGKSPSNTNKPYGLNSSGSRYISLASNYVFTFNNSPINISIGGELSVYNFMFQNNRYITRNTKGDSVTFRNYNDDFQRNLSRSKLTSVYLNIPLQFRLALLKNLNKTKVLELDFGGYVGYRLTSHSSIRISGERNRQRTENDFLLNNWRYGVEAGVSVHGVRLFGKYDLSSMFANPQLPNLNILTLGIKIITM